MTQFPNFRQPALGIQDAVMVPAQTAGNLLMQRLAAAEAAFVPMTTQTFDSTTSSTRLNATAASTGSGSLRSLMIPVSTANFVPIVPNPSPAFYNGQLYSQFGNQALVDAIIASQTGAGCMAGRAVLKACGAQHYGDCGCSCTPVLGEEVEIDEENSNGIDDGDAEVVVPPRPPVYSPSVQLADAKLMSSPCGQTATPAAVETQSAQAANIQYVTYNA